MPPTFKTEGMAITQALRLASRVWAVSSEEADFAR